MLLPHGQQMRRYRCAPGARTILVRTAAAVVQAVERRFNQFSRINPHFPEND
jgi:hypothetical protein